MVVQLIILLSQEEVQEVIVMEEVEVQVRFLKVLQ
jgi:hypothetical protein